MKLRNKKTGEEGYLYANKNENYNVLDADDKVLAVYSSLAELNEEWEDYEESKEYWSLDGYAYPVLMEKNHKFTETQNAERDKEIGNYFETKEEAEKAVEKLKAWKRLRDKGFKFKGWYASGYPGEFSIEGEGKHFDSNDIQKDLDLLFGSEE